MKTTGIIMSGNHPRLILDGTKTMTRRTWGLEKINENPDEWWCCGLEYVTEGYRWHFESGSQSPHTLFIKNPYGDVGDQLWVRETYLENEWGTFYLADGSKELQECGVGAKWKPSRFMPRSDSRILLEITAGSRAERVQKITEGDAMKEGIPNQSIASDRVWRTRVDGFKVLWDSLNAKRGYGWDFNPWVFVSPFKLGGTC